MGWAGFRKDLMMKYTTVSWLVCIAFGIAYMVIGNYEIASTWIVGAIVIGCIRFRGEQGD